MLTRTNRKHLQHLKQLSLIPKYANAPTHPCTHTDAHEQKNFAPTHLEKKKREFDWHARQRADETLCNSKHCTEMVICLLYGSVYVCVTDPFYVCIPSSKVLFFSFGVCVCVLCSSYCSSALATSWKPAAVVLLRSHVTLLRGIKPAGNGGRQARRGRGRRSVNF